MDRRLVASSMLIGVVAAGSAHANTGGITGRSGNPGVNAGANCTECHGSAGPYDYDTPLIAQAGPIQQPSFEVGSVVAFELRFPRLSGTNATRAGFNLSVTGGALRDPQTDSSVRKPAGTNELTHGAPVAPDGAGNFTWQFHWQAPASPGSYTFYMCTNPVNSNGANTGDGTVRCGSHAVAVVAAPNAAPVARDDHYAAPPDTTTIVAAPGVLDNDTDANGDALTATKLTDPTHGTLTLDGNGGFTYVPDPGFTGTDTFTYKAGDGALESAAATVTITVAAGNTAPSASADAYSTGPNAALNVAAPGVLANDSDPDGAGLAATLVAPAAHGDVQLESTGALRYTPQPGFSGTDSFTYQANDGAADSNVAKVTVSVVEPAPAPTGGGNTGGGGGGGAMPGVLWLLALARRLGQSRGLKRSKRRCISP